MKKAKKNLKKNFIGLMKSLGEIVAKSVILTQLKIDRYILFRYFGVETPLYKLWWRCRVENIQRALDAQNHR